MAGLDTTGFVSKDVDTLLAELEANEKSAFGNSLNVRPTSVMGVLNGIMATKFNELWDVGNEVWASQNPDTSTGTSLDQLCQLTGVLRKAATQSTTTLALSGVNGTVIEALRRVKNSQTSTFWTNPASATIGAGATTPVAFNSEDFGPIAALAGTLTIIDTPVSGWESVTNAADATLGISGESDAELRVRRAALLTAIGKGTIDSIRADVAAVTDVLSVVVFENFTGVTDSLGLPAKSFEVVAEAGAANDIAQAIWGAKPAGISAYGQTTGNALDALGATRVVGYTTATPKNVYVTLTAATGTGFSGLTADIAANIVNVYGAQEFIGDDVSYNAVGAHAFITGVKDVPNFHIDFFAAPTASSSLVIGIRERAKFDSSRFVVYLV